MLCFLRGDRRWGAAPIDCGMAHGAKRTSGKVDLRTLLRREVRRQDRLLDGPRVVLSAEASRRLDRASAQEFGVPSIVLMEHASLGLAGAVREVCRKSRAGVLILAGPGNNGGDGTACARHLLNAGVERVSVVLVAERGRAQGDAATNLVMAERMGVRVIAGHKRPGAAIRREEARLGEPLLIVDALLGTGLSRPAAGAALEAIRACNALREAGADVATLAVDVPSGCDADSGCPPEGGEAIVADGTLTMAGMKAGLRGRAGREWAGIVGIVSIGAPRKLLRRLGKADSASEGRGPKPGFRRDGGG